MVTKVQTFQAGSGDFGETGSQRISAVSNQANGKEKSDSFVVDIEGFSHFVEKDLSPKSRISWQRKLSRKGYLRGAAEQRTCSSPTSKERDGSLVSAATSSPKASTVVESFKMAEVALGSAADHSTGSPIHHQITITTGSVGTNNAAESKWNNRRSYSFRGPPATWVADPRKILFFFATLSSLGTMLLIFLTLSMRRTGVEYGSLE